MTDTTAGEGVQVPRLQMKMALANAIWSLDRNETTSARVEMCRAQDILTRAAPAQPDTGDAAALREAFLCLLTNSADSGVRFDYDGDADDEGRTVVTCDVTIKVDHHDLQEFCDALGMTGPLGEGLEDRLNRYIEHDAALSKPNAQGREG